MLLIVCDKGLFCVGCGCGRGVGVARTATVERTGFDVTGGREGGGGEGGCG